MRRASGICSTTSQSGFLPEMCLTIGSHRQEQSRYVVIFIGYDRFVLNPSPYEMPSCIISISVLNQWTCNRFVLNQFPYEMRRASGNCSTTSEASSRSLATPETLFPTVRGVGNFTGVQGYLAHMKGGGLYRSTGVPHSIETTPPLGPP